MQHIVVKKFMTQNPKAKQLQAKLLVNSQYHVLIDSTKSSSAMGRKAAYTFLELQTLSKLFLMGCVKVSVRPKFIVSCHLLIAFCFGSFNKSHIVKQIDQTAFVIIAKSTVTKFIMIQCFVSKLINYWLVVISHGFSAP